MGAFKEADRRIGKLARRPIWSLVAVKCQVLSVGSSNGLIESDGGWLATLQNV